MLPDSARQSIKIVVDLSWWTGLEVEGVINAIYDRDRRSARAIAPRRETEVLARADPFLPFYARFARCKALTPALAHSSTYVTTARWRAWLYPSSQESPSATCCCSPVHIGDHAYKSSPLCEMRA